MEETKVHGIRRDKDQRDLLNHSYDSAGKNGKPLFFSEEL